LGQDDVVFRSSPVQVGSGTTWSQISVGEYFIAAVKTDGTLWSWGLNTTSQLGLNDKVTRSSPVQVGALTNWSKVSGGKTFIAAIKTDGTLWTWGRGFNGQYGTLGQNDTLVWRSSPTQVGSATNWNQISTGYNMTLAITSN
jgi:alpha-tubulin suppressor-like RCC1 family protein